MTLSICTGDITKNTGIELIKYQLSQVEIKELIKKLQNDEDVKIIIPGKVT